MGKDEIRQMLEEHSAGVISEVRKLILACTCHLAFLFRTWINKRCEMSLLTSYKSYHHVKILKVLKVSTTLLARL